MTSRDFPLHQLQSAEQVQLLNDIDKLRSDGVQYHDISLPQLVVCGDQSSGKSSVLEALSNVKFPVDQGTCTRFAMELALRRSPDRKTTAKIIPGKNTLPDRLQRLADFQPSEVGLADVAGLIEKARVAMGLSEDHAICDDVLRLEITGPDLPHLTLVDLPGLIADAKDTEDIKLIDSMVKKYMEMERSIILAIVSAQNDKQNQKVLRLAREIDPQGDRTVGIITKPDMLKNYRGSVAERTYLEMAKNQDPVSKLRLGWHVVRNPDYHEKKDATYNRDEKEREVFSQEPWNELSKWQLGIGSLRDELTKHLFNQMRSELPRVVEDIEREEIKCEQELKDLGEVRATRKDQEKYLIGISGRFGQLVGAGLEGHWTSDPVFNVESMRLRAQIRNLNDAFERQLMTEGHAFEIFPPGHQGSRASLSFGVARDAAFESRADLFRKADKIIKSARGQELPGMFDPIRVSDIFRDQSRGWQDLARQYVGKAWQLTSQFLQNLFFKITPARTSTAEAILNGIVLDEMLYRKKELDTKLAELMLPYVKNVPVCTPARMAASLKQIVLEDENTEQGKSQLNSLADGEVDIDACLMLLRHSQAYYNIARDTFIDNVTTLAIENCLLSGLARIFTSDMILDMNDNQLARLAGESEQTLSDRKYAEEKSRLLKKSLETCRLHMSRRPILREGSRRGLAKELAGFSPSSDATPPGTGLFGASTQAASSTAVPHQNPLGQKPGESAPLDGLRKPTSFSDTHPFGGISTAGLFETDTAPSIMQPSTNANFPGTGSSATPAFISMLTSSRSPVAHSTSVNAPNPSLGLFGTQSSANAPPSTKSLFGNVASVNMPSSSTGIFGTVASVNTPASSTSGFGTVASVNTPLFGSALATSRPISGFSGFGQSSNTNVSAGSAQGFSFGKPVKSADVTTLSPGFGAPNPVPGHQSPFSGALSTSRAATPSQTTPSSSKPAQPMTQTKIRNERTARAQYGRLSDSERGQILAICYRLSSMSLSRIKQENDGKRVSYECSSKALLQGKEEKSFEEIRLEDRRLMADQTIKEFILTCDPHAFGRMINPLEIEDWCRWFMANASAPCYQSLNTSTPTV